MRVHNLRDIDVEIPRNRLTVITGLSGSGKSSLAFDTLYAEGRRRYVECLSTYTQQFLERTARPDVDQASGLPPAIAIERAVPASQARSTVGTTTEVHDYLRLLFARAGTIACIDCGRDVGDDPASAVADELIHGGGRGIVLFEADAPRSTARWRSAVRELERSGFSRLWQAGRAITAAEAVHEDGPLAVVVDRLAFERSKRARIVEAVETAYRFGRDRCLVSREGGPVRRFSRGLHCTDCDRRYRAPEPRLFSPNSPLGACPDCQGFGRTVQADLDRIVPDRGRTLAEGAVDPWTKPSYRKHYDKLRRAGKRMGLAWDVPYGELPTEHRRLVERGGQGFPGIDGFFRWLERRTYKVHVRVFLARYRSYRRCASCSGARLRAEATAVRIAGRSIAQIGSMPIAEVGRWIAGLELEQPEAAIAARILHELTQRLRFLTDVGLGYLSLDRPSRTLSGGEAQRIQLAQSLGSALVDTLYVLDEPSVGLHPLDVERLIHVLEQLRDLGNTVVVVEHDPRVIIRADWLLDLGPGAGAEGGRLLYQGAPAGLRRARDSVTRSYLHGRTATARVRKPSPSDGWIELGGARTHNLRDITVRIPRAAMTVVTGVSGSGKSSLVHDTLHGALARALGGPPRETGRHRALRGFEGLSGVDLVDQSAIGRSARSNPVTYVKAFDGIRRRLAATTLARARGLRPGFFSFNVPGGRCESCEGAGTLRVEMHFLPDMLIPCDDCGGSRFGPAALEVRDRGRNVAQILELTIREALESYADAPEVAGRLQVLADVGLGYLRLGQPAPTLSGGEAQRLKLAAHLRARGRGPRVFLLDEPTTGLHLHDVAVLVGLLRRLVEDRHTVVVVEHHLQVIRAADWVVDLGPGAGPDGGQLVAQGTPERVARSNGPTGAYLRGEGPGASALTFRD